MEHETEAVPEAGSSAVRASPTLSSSGGDVQRERQTAGSGEIEKEKEEEEGPELPLPAPPSILITTSPSPCKDTYTFCEELRGVFPGGEFFKRPKGRGYELGRISRWAAKRGFGAVIVVNEDHKTPSKNWKNSSASADTSRCYHFNAAAYWPDRVLQAYKRATRSSYICEFTPSRALS